MERMTPHALQKTLSLLNVPSLWSFVMTALQTKKRNDIFKIQLPPFPMVSDTHFLLCMKVYYVYFSMVLGLYSPLLFFSLFISLTLHFLIFSYTMAFCIIIHWGASICPSWYVNSISMSVNYYKARLNPHLPVPLQFPTPTSSPCLSFHVSAFIGPPSPLMHPSSTESFQGRDFRLVYLTLLRSEYSE